MMNAFTPEAQHVLQRAQDIMLMRHHAQLEVEHIFYALLEQTNDKPAFLIRQVGGDTESMFNRLYVELGKIAEDAGNYGTLTHGGPRVERLLQRAAEEAQLLGSERIGTEHLLLAVVDEEEGPTRRIVESAGLEKEGVYAALRGG